jgi:hypothetical protein
MIFTLTEGNEDCGLDRISQPEKIASSILESLEVILCYCSLILDALSQRASQDKENIEDSILNVPWGW